MKVDSCIRCGRCCVYSLFGSEPRRCPMLIGIVGKKTTCKIYKHPIRLGLIIDRIDGVPIRCGLRRDDFVVKDGKRVFRNLEGCPHNIYSINEKYNSG